MRQRVAIVVAIHLLVACSLEAQSRTRAVRTRGGPCSEVRGVPGVFRSLDGGQTFTTNADARPIGMWDIGVFEDAPEVVVAVASRSVYDSHDGGCNWTQRYTIEKELHHQLRLTVGSGGRAFIWSDELLLRYDSSSVSELRPSEPIGGLGVNPLNNAHVRALSLLPGTLWESLDGGDTWRIKGSGAGGAIQATAFDPADFNHIVAATNRGLAVTRNGGDTWTVSQAFPRFVCDVRFVRHSPNVLWAAITVASGSDNIYRSIDGGARFDPLARLTDVEPGVCLPLVAHPFDSNHAAVPFRSLYLIDAAARSVTPTTCCDGASIFRVAYSAADPNVVFIYAFRQ